MKRHKLTRKGNKRLFKATADKTKSINVRPMLMQQPDRPFASLSKTTFHTLTTRQQNKITNTITTLF